MENLNEKLECLRDLEMELLCLTAHRYKDVCWRNNDDYISEFIDGFIEKLSNTEEELWMKENDYQKYKAIKLEQIRNNIELYKEFMLHYIATIEYIIDKLLEEYEEFQEYDEDTPERKTYEKVEIMIDKLDIVEIRLYKLFR